MKKRPEAQRRSAPTKASPIMAPRRLLPVCFPYMCPAMCPDSASLYVSSYVSLDVPPLIDTYYRSTFRERQRRQTDGGREGGRGEHVGVGGGGRMCARIARAHAYPRCTLCTACLFEFLKMCHAMPDHHSSRTLGSLLQPR